MLAENIPTLFMEMLSLIYEHELRLMREAGLSLLEYYALQVLNFSQETSFKEISQRLSLPKSTVTFVADSLERKGLADRQRHKDDRRVWLLRLTEAGRGKMAEVLEKKASYTLPVLNVLSTGEVQILAKVMQGVASQLKASQKTVKGGKI
ncbi:MAG: MarR family transcriptional regulator [Chloroflexi bacterium]|nr:MarR family transcriptional regulator [Chloroflexota bacterium]